MNSSIIIIAILLAGLVGLLMLKLRLRCRVGDGEQKLFAGLGRTGVEFDWAAGTGRLLLFGFQLKQFELEKELFSKKVTDKKAKPESQDSRRSDKAERVRPVKDIIAVVKSSFIPLWRWLISVLRATRFEELQGNVKAGFESIDLTGQTFGYYHALVGAVPALAGRMNYEPDWEGASFNANLKASLAMPLYSLVGRTIQLAFRLPLRKIVNLAIGREKKEKKEKVGNPNGQ